MTKKSKGEYRVGVGASSVLMILVVLAMTALGLLSLGSARQTEAQTKRNLQTTIDYYTAADSAQAAIARIDGAAADYAAQGGGEPFDRLWFSAYDIDARFTDEQDGVVGFTLTLPAGDEHELTVKGTVSPTGSPRVNVSVHALATIYTPPQGDGLLLMGE